MRIAIDYTTGIYPGAGIARYTRQLVASLADIDSRNAYSLFYAAIGLPRSTPEGAQAGKIDVLLTNGDSLDPPPILKPYHGLTWLENKGTFPFEPHRLADCYGIAGCRGSSPVNGCMLFFARYSVNDLSAKGFDR